MLNLDHSSVFTIKKTESDDRLPNKHKESMATVEWKNLPSDILSNLAKLLNSDVDNLRLRSVCSSWRSSLPPPHKPFSFPLKLPPLYSPTDFPFYRLLLKAEELIGDFVLVEITLYRLSPPSDDDSFNGWLLKVSSQTNSEAFTLLNPVTMEKMEDPIPKQVNLLDYGISEICKYHNMKFTGNDQIMMIGHKKVIALWNYFTDCDFAALVLESNARMEYWKIGDEDWTPIDSMIDDVILFHGKCYAVYNGVLLCFDSDSNLTLVASSPRVDYLNLIATYLVECKSDLYVVWYYGYDAEQFGDEIYQQPSELGLRKFNECNGSLDSVEDLSDVFFILSDCASHSFSANDFAGFIGNRVYVNHDSFDLEVKYGDMIGVYHSEDSGKEISPPSWLHA